jgi:xanthine dehydrogenase accessory factor
MPSIILIRGGGDLASGVAMRLHRAGIRVLITELPEPLVIRRLASFAQAVYAREYTLEDITARRAVDWEDLHHVWEAGQIPVLVDPRAEAIAKAMPVVVVDARMTKKPSDLGIDSAPLVIGLGPGFSAGENCHAVVETMRGHFLGRVIWNGPAQPNTGVPGMINGHQMDRVLRAPTDGILKAQAAIGDQLASGQIVATVAGEPVRAAFKGVLRGLIQPGLQVKKGLKVGDVDPRADPSHCTTVSDKALAIGGGVLEAVLTRPGIRSKLW